MKQSNSKKNKEENITSRRHDSKHQNRRKRKSPPSDIPMEHTNYASAGFFGLFLPKK